MRLPVFVHRLHRWLGLALGLQVLLWISGGLVMSALPLERVRGEDRARTAAEGSFSAADGLVSPAAAAAAAGLADFDGARLVRRLGAPAYLIAAGGLTRAVDARGGGALPDLDAAAARRVAVADYAGAAAVAAVVLQTAPAVEIRGRTLPLWRVAFADGRRTTLYVSPVSGDVVARRNRLWRVYDVFWMLHIMDYRARDDFNHPLLVGSAAVAWFLAVSGVWLVLLWLRRRGRRRRGPVAPPPDNA